MTPDNWREFSSNFERSKGVFLDYVKSIFLLEESLWVSKDRFCRRYSNIRLHSHSVETCKGYIQHVKVSVHWALRLSLDMRGTQVLEMHRIN